jgi:hypothetical protein
MRFIRGSRSTARIDKGAGMMVVRFLNRSPVCGLKYAFKWAAAKAQDGPRHFCVRISAQIVGPRNGFYKRKTALRRTT